MTQPDLVQAGLDANVDPATLHLYAEAIEQPIQITGATSGPGGFGPQAAIYFYGRAIDTLYSGTRVYWLAAQESQGPRIQQMPALNWLESASSEFPLCGGNHAAHYVLFRADDIEREINSLAR